MEGGESSLFLNRRLLIGPFLTALILLLLEISSRLFGMTVPNPAVIYLTAVVYAVFEGGIVPGAISACMTLFYAASFFSLPGRLFHYSDENAARMIVLMVATPAITVMTGVLKLRSERMLREQKKLVADLKKALADVRTLQGILPICAACKQVRDDNGYWKQVEKYIEEHSEARFTHGICPDCAKRLYPELYEGRDIDPSLIT